MMLSDTQRLVLSRASRHEARLAAPPMGLPAAARDAVFRSMLRNDLLAERAAPREFAGLAWRQGADGAGVALRVTDAGLRAIGTDPAEGAAAVDAASPAAPHQGPAALNAPGTDAALGAPTTPESGTHAMAGANANADDEGDLRQAAVNAEPAELPGQPAPASRGSLRQAHRPTVVGRW